MSPSSCCCSCSSQFSPEVPEHTEICGPGSQANNFEFEIIPDHQNKVEIIAVLKTIFTSSTINFKPSMCSHCANSLQRLYLVYTEFNELLNAESTLGKVLKKVEVGAVIKEEYEVIEEIQDAVFGNGRESDGEETDPLLLATEDDNEGQNPPLNFCKDCKMSFLSDEEFKKHRQNVHYRPNQRTTCPICNYSYGSPWHLREHQRRMHRDIVPSSSNNVPPEGGSAGDDGKTFKCNLCLRKFKYSDALRRHMEKMHVKWELHSCPEKNCPLSFSKKVDLFQHVELFHPELDIGDVEVDHSPEQEQVLQHTGAKRARQNISKGPHVCVQCGSSYSKRKGLLEHERSKHGRETKHACSICGKGFGRSRELSKHTCNNHGDGDEGDHT